MIVTIPERQKDSFALLKDFYKKYDEIVIHSHDYFEVTLVANGQGIHYTKEDSIQIFQWDLFVYDLDVVHAFFPLENTNKAKLTVYNILISKTMMRRMCDKSLIPGVLENFFYKKKEEGEKHYLRVSLSDFQAYTLQDIFNRLNSEFVYNDQMGDALSTLLIAEVFEYFVRNYNKTKTKKPFYKNVINVENAVKYIDDNFRNNIRVEYLCKKAGVSKSVFSDLFKRMMHCTIIEYVQKKRIDEARNLLLSTNKSVLEIAFEVGYENYKYFYNLFRKMTGCSPKQYVRLFKAHENNQDDSTRK